jgi:hypothetical protein
VQSGDKITASSVCANQRRIMNGRISRAVFPVLLSIAIASCSAAPPPATAPAPVVYVPPADAPPPDEWNLFPDPTTGQVDVYHEGEYVGAVTGNEPAGQDPPIPHPVAPAN